jgi:hypothetical protein
MKLAVLLAALCMAAPVAAQNVIKVARAEVKLPAGEWVTLPQVLGDGLRVEGFAGVEAEVQTAFLVHGGAVRAWVEVAATPRTFGYPLELANICRTRSATVWSLAVEEGNPLDLQCVAATAAFGATRALEARPTLSAAARARGLSLPSEVVFISAHMLRKMGLLMRINLYAEPGFVGDTQNLPKDTPARVSAQHGAFALQLSARVRDCMYSIRCAVELPAVQFADAAALSK